jgi:ABC-type sugar transport system permease subunit
MKLGDKEVDQVEEVARYSHIVLPIVGAILMFLMIFIAITMA